jgi:gliding motility-associated-like protein
MSTKLIRVLLSLLLTAVFLPGVLANKIAVPVASPRPYSLFLSFPNGFNQFVFAIQSDDVAQPVTICSGARVRLYGDTQNAGDTYLWQVQQADGTWTAAPVTAGNTNTDYSYPADGLTNNSTNNTNVLYHLRRQVTSGGTTVTYDSYYDVTVQPNNPITNNNINPPSVTTSCDQTNVSTITGSVPSGGSGGLTYQWQISTDGGATYSPIANAILPNYTPGTVSATTSFKRVVSSNSCTIPSTSNVVTITIVPAVTNYDINPPSPTEFCASGDPNVIVGNLPQNGTGSYTYQWQSSTDGTNFTNISGANAKDYDPPVLSTTTYYQRVVTSGACTGPYVSSVVQITIDQPVLGNTVSTPANTVFCASGTPGALTGSTPTGGNGNYTYQWQISTDGSTFADIAGANSKDYTVPAVSATTYYRRRVTGGGCQLPDPSNVITITVQPAITDNAINTPATTTFCGGNNPGTITGNTPSGGNGTYTYQWQSSTDGTNFTDIATATNPNYAPGTVSATTYYRRTVTSGSCTTPQPSAAVLITIQQPISNNTITPPSQVNFCGPGTPGAITGTIPQGGDGINYTYQWQVSTDNVNFSNVSTGGNGVSYTPPATTGTFYYRRTVVSGSCTTPQASNTVSITIQNVIGNNIISAATTTFCGPSDPGTITGTTPTGGDGTNYTYQWQSSTDGNTFNNIASATAKDYAPGTVSSTIYYRRLVASGVCTTPQPSAPVLITIQQPLSNNIITPPSQTNFCGTGTPGAITGSIAQGGDGVNYTYQWQVSTDNVNFTNITTGGNGVSYTPPATIGTFYYRRTVVSGSCITAQPSNVVSITMQPAIVNNSITSPSPSVFCGSNTPTNIIGSTAAGGSGTLIYQWQSSADGTSFTDIAGANTKDYTFTGPLTQSTYYRRTVTSGSCQVPSISSAVLITIQQPISNNTITPPSQVNFCGPGTPGAITGAAAQGGDGVNYSYQWQVSTDNVNFSNITSGGNGVSYTPPATTGTFYYRRTVISGSCTTPQLSNTVSITIQNVISNNIISAATTTFCGPSDPGTITGTLPTGGDGTNYTYQWQSSTDGTTFNNIASATAKDYAPGTVSANTYYRRLVTSGVCTTPQASAPVLITVQQPITNNTVTPPSPTFFCGKGTPGIITGTAAQGGDGVNYTYQWQVSTDNVNFTNVASGGNGVSYTPPAINGTFYYRRTVVSGSCTTPQASNVVSIAIQDVISNNKIATGSPTTLCGPQTPGTLAGSAPTGGDGVNYAYQWQSSTDGTNYTDIAGATTQFYTPTSPITVSTYFRRLVASGVCTTPQPSAPILIIVQPAISNNTITPPSPTFFCGTGTPGIITGSAAQGGDGTNYTYQWQVSTDNVNFTNVTTGGNGISYTPPATKGTFYYRRIVSSGSCATPQPSNTVSITIQDVISNNRIATGSPTTLCGPQTPGTFAGSTPSGGDGVNYNYQWQSSTDGTNYTDIQGANTQFYTPTAPITVSTYFRRVVYSGVCTTPQPTAPILITVQPAISNNTINPPAITDYCGTGGMQTIAGSLPTGGDGSSYTYQWQSSTDNVNFTDIATGGNGQNFTPPATMGLIYYRRVVSSGSCSTPQPTASVAITVEQTITNNTITPPSQINFCGPGKPQTLVGSAPQGGNGSYTYQWQSSTDGTTFTNITGETGQSYSPSGSISQNTWFRRIVVSGACQTPSISDNVVEITINTPLANNTITAPAATFCVTSSPIAITGSTPTGGNGVYNYQWQSSVDNATFNDIVNANGPDYTTTALSKTTYFRRTVTSGACTTPNLSGSVVVTILPLPPVPVPTAAVVNNCLGSSATLSVTSPQTGIIYNWYDSPAKTNLLHTGSVYVTPQLTANATFYVESSNGTCSNATLGSVQVNIVPLPTTPSVASASVNTCSGVTTVLSVSSPQAGTTYNWYQTATGGTAVYTGATFSTPALTATTTYYVEAVSSAGCSSPARAAVVVNVSPLPQVAAQGTAVCPGSTATLNVTSNMSNVAYNWYTSATNASAIFTGNSFTTPALTNNTTYYVEAVNTLTGCSSGRIAVGVNILQPLPAPVVSIGSSTGNSVTFKWDAITGATGYLVSLDNGQTFVSPSSGGNGLTHTVTGLAYNQYVTIIVKAIGAQPCETSPDSQPVTATAKYYNDVIFVPNAFTPNGDGKNDIVYVHNEEIKSLTFTIYDQWGELLFMSTDKSNGWDGTYKGNKEPVGVYVYYVKAIMNDGHEVNQKGTITLLR